MAKNYVRAYPNYKQQALNKITNVLIDILRETNFFRKYPQTHVISTSFSYITTKCTSKKSSI